VLGGVGNVEIAEDLVAAVDSDKTRAAPAIGGVATVNDSALARVGLPDDGSVWSAGGGEIDVRGGVIGAAA